MIERLDARLLFATLAGTVFSDADSSATYDTGESPLKAVTVYIDANANGRFDTGEATTLTDKGGHFAFSDLPAGDTLVGVAGPRGQGQTTPGQFGTIKGDFDIDLVGLDGLKPAVQRAFTAAAARWEAIITGDLPAVGNIDDIRISVTVDNIDGDGGTLAQSSPTAMRPFSELPYRGEMEFDESDIDSLIADGHFADTVAHEMAHVLGFGTIWSDLGLISGEGTSKPRFLGKEAAKQYNALFDMDASSVPVESRGGSGTADSHWPETTFTEELLTGYTESAGTLEPISRVTVGQFADLGYDVNLNAADTWDPFTHATTLTTALAIGGKPFERRVTLGKKTTAADLDFGFRADTAPVIGRFSTSATMLGETTNLSAGRITDAEGDDIAGVTFYGESNGITGLQGGRGGDTYLGAAKLANNSWTLTATTAGLAAGSQAFYAVATDALGLAGRRTTTATLTAPPPPTRPNPVVATRQSRTSTLLQWRDRSDNEIGFRIELSDDAGYATISRAFNVPANTAASLFTGLTHGTTYYVRIRSYGYGGASAYTRLSGVRV